MFKRTSSATSTTNETSYTSSTTTNDERVAADNGAIVSRGGVVNVNNTTTDGGAIVMAGEVAEQAIDAGALFARMGGDLAAASLDHVEDAYRNAAEREHETMQMAFASQRDDAAQLSEQMINMIPYVVVGLVAWSIFK